MFDTPRSTGNVHWADKKATNLLLVTLEVVCRRALGGTHFERLVLSICSGLAALGRGRRERSRLRRGTERVQLECHYGIRS